MQWIRHKLVWFFGLVLLTGSLLGANYYYHNAPRDGSARKDPAPPVDRPANRNAVTGVNPTAVVAPENEPIPLAPSAMGEVTKVFVKADEAVKKGDPLLQIDDRRAKYLLTQAEANVKAAESMVQKARLGLQQYGLKLTIQQQVIAAKKKELESKKTELAKAERFIQEGVKLPPEDLKAKQELVEAADWAIRAEETTLKLLDISKPDSELTQANANLEAAKAKRDEAQWAVDACLMTAPADGTIYKVGVGVGAKFGQQIQQPAFWFYTGGLTIKAYIDPEWVSRVGVGQKATVYEQGSGKGKSWTGKVTYIADSFQPKRDATAIPDLLQQGQEPVLECRITLDDGQTMPRLNQKVHVHIKGD